MTTPRSIAAKLRLWMAGGHPIFERLRIFCQAALVLVVLLYGTWLIHLHFVYARIPYRSLSIAVSFLFMQTVAILLELAISFTIKRRRETIAERARRTRPVIQEQLAAHLAGADLTSRLRRLSRHNRAQVEICVVEGLMAVHGYGQDRIRALAVDLGFADSWKKRLSSRNAQRRKECVEYLGLLGQSELRPILEKSLSDPDPLVCAAACRSLLGLGGTTDTARLFRLAIEGPLLLRSMVAGDLRRHSLALSSRGLPELAAATEPQILAGLGVIGAWERLLHVPQVASLTLHSSVEVRAAAIRSLGFVQASVDTESLILAALEDPAPEIRLAAVFACSQRGLRSSIDSLARQLRGDNQTCTAAACDALATMGDDGWNILENCVLDPNRALAGKALEALSAARLKPASALQIQ
jgi:hypothetical protein